MAMANATALLAQRRPGSRRAPLSNNTGPPFTPARALAAAAGALGLGGADPERDRAGLQCSRPASRQDYRGYRRKRLRRTPTSRRPAPSRLTTRALASPGSIPHHGELGLNGSGSPFLNWFEPFAISVQTCVQNFNQVPCACPSKSLLAFGGSYTTPMRPACDCEIDRLKAGYTN